MNDKSSFLLSTRIVSFLIFQKTKYLPMKLLSLSMLGPICFGISTLSAQETDTRGLQEFAAVYTTGENWDQALSPAEQPYFIQHSMFLSGLRKTGVVTAGMRVAEMGIILLKAKDLEAVRKLFEDDISVTEKTFKLDVHPATVFYKGCLGE